MFTLNCKGRLLIGQQPLIMGIINVTPDSFYAGSRLEHADQVLQRVESMLAMGADIIDIGAQSTRPDAALLSAEEELARLADLFELLSRQFPEGIFSIDSFYSKVAAVCVAAGASMVNDISGGEMDPEMIPVTGKLNVPYVCMHMRGTPRTMQQFTDYQDLTGEVLDYFIKKMEICHEAGIKDVILDPGFGFSKTIAQNFELLDNLQTLRITGKPLLVGLSRKSTIYRTLGITAGESLNGTTVMNTVALLNGADMLRVHDVKEARECIRLLSRLPSLASRS